MEYQLLTPPIQVNSSLSPIEQVFVNRGIYPQDINHYLHTNQDDILDPRLIDNIQQGAKMLISHLSAGDKIFIQVDSDVDGYTSAAILINYINKIAPGHAQQNISYRIHDGKQHGILIDTIPEGTKLVIIPDAGSNQFEEHEQLASQGIDVLVIDHHEADKVSDYACIINNQTCNYPNKTLSGAGMVYKFCAFIDSLIGTDYAEDLLDLAVFGVVSDMMDIRSFETKQLIKLGVHNLKNPFIQSFVKEQEYSLKGEVTPIGISFYIAPYINATIRVGTYDEKMLLFESMLEFKAYEVIPSTKRGCKGQFETRVEQACRNCKNIKNRQTKARDTSLEIIRDIIKKNDLLSHPVLIIQLDTPIEENLTGLIANQIMGEYMRPVLLLNRYIEVDESTGEVIKFAWRGSGRNATYSKLENFREFLANCEYVEYAQGHASAFGVSILDENLDKFKKYIDEELKDFDFSNCYRVDFIWIANEVEKYRNDIMDIGGLNSVWGQELPEPQIAIENIQLHRDNIILMSPDKKPTLKIVLPGNLSLIKFGSSQEEYDSLYSEMGCVIINIVGTCNLNFWQGNTSPQIIIKDYEIVSKSAYYF